MNAEELRHRLKTIFGDQLIFNKEFDMYADAIKNINQNLIEWCGLLKEGKIRALRAPRLEGALVFIKKIGSSNRCLVIKIVNGEFREIHLADHDYYDRMRKTFGLKKDNTSYQKILTKQP